MAANAIQKKIGFSMTLQAWGETGRRRAEGPLLVGPVKSGATVGAFPHG